jgi:iron(III) transport system ATP-binding protein
MEQALRVEVGAEVTVTGRSVAAMFENADDPIRKLENCAEPDGFASAPFLRLESIVKSFGSFTALRDIDLVVNEGEFICFLGPSGCGKSTLLRIVAGLETQTSGRLFETGRDISRDSAAQRGFGILFQSYALFPNLNVYQNIVYGLHGRGSRAESEQRAAELLQLVDLTGTDRKFPAQLSGGQQQRVALARAIAPSPRLLLLDEPLSALDAKVRIHLRRQIRELQRRLAVTTIMVTHDQEEALTMADRVVVMNQGTVEQVGTPTEIYYSPRTPFVANFVGKMNFLPATMEGRTKLRVGSAVFDHVRPHQARLDGEVLACVRPEHVKRVVSGGLPATVSHVEFLGPCWRVTLAVPALDTIDLVGDFAGGEGFDPPVHPGKHIEISIPSERVVVFSAGGPAAPMGH